MSEMTPLEALAAQYGLSEYREMKAKITKLREAIKPMALIAERDIGGSDADEDFYRPMDAKHARAPLLKVGHLRRARKVYEETA